jgi:alanine-glyoxylate transaminase/serine-glyoxylate transaminase/serine-pyruvate transaminase
MRATMANERPLLMIPGPIEVSPAVQAAFEAPPPSHLAPAVIEAFGRGLEQMREVWLAAPEDQPFVVSGGGTLAMEMAVANLVAPEDEVLVVNTGYFSDRIAEMLRRQGALVAEVAAEVGDAPTPNEVAAALAGLAARGPVKALFATHVDTSTGVRIDPEPLARLAREAGALSVFDGVCATAAEPFRMADWGADVYLTASQKALGLPAGLALMVVSPRALSARAALAEPPAMYLDWQQWLPIMTAYEQRRPSYFSTPATNLILALPVALAEILADGIEARFAAHQAAADSLRAAWAELGLEPVPKRPELCSNALSALRFPAGVDAALVGRIAEHGVVVAGGLHPEIRGQYFRVGHMGYTVTQPAMLQRTVEAVRAALSED